MRVVFLTHNFPRWPGDTSGEFLATLAHALIARGVDVRVVAPADGGEVGEPEMNGIPVRRVRYGSAAAEVLAYRGTMASVVKRPGGWRALMALLRAMRNGVREELADGADLVHAHWWVPGGLAVPSGIPFVLTLHGTDGAIIRRSRLARFAARGVFKRARVVTTVSRLLATTVQENFRRPVLGHHVQPMPVNTSAFSWTRGGGGLVVVSRLTPQKRVHLALDALACLVALDHLLPLTIVGDGPERDRLERQAVALGISELVTFTGAVTHEEIPKHLAQADLMLFPAEGEGFGLVAAEALIAGVPVVACWDGGGVLDIVPERGAGRLVLPSGEAIADAALDILQDGSRLTAVIEAGERWRRELSPDHVAEVCQEWYAEATRA